MPASDNKRTQHEQYIINTIGNPIKYCFSPIADFNLDYNKMIVCKKLEEAAHTYNVARHFFREAELVPMGTRLDTLSIAFNQMMFIQTAAIWLNNAIDIFLQAEWFGEKLHKETVTVDNYESILQSCNLKAVKKQQKVNI